VRIITWNVNGIRSVAKKGLFEWLQTQSADLIALQETRIDSASLSDELRCPPGYHAAWAFAKRKGYSGVATFSRQPPSEVHHQLGKPRFDDEGRFVATEHAGFILFNVYFPKGSGTLRDNSRVPYKLAFYDALFAHIRKVSQRRGKPVIVAGDFNTAHREIDVKNWRTNRKTSGFLPEERASFERHLKRGFVDIYREHHPEREQYTWWSQRIGCRERNIGWRIDYLWVSKELAPRITEAFILDQVRGSDHCPLGIVIDL
jgi:exodeoxyribonuclease-3